jgi:hypothetical protein
MTCRPADLHPGYFISLSGCDYELISIDQTDDFTPCTSNTSTPADVH